MLARRRLLAAAFAAVAVVAGLHEVAAPPPPTARVVTAARDLAAGTTIEATDLRAVELAEDAVPAGVVAEAVGQVLAAPVRDGEPITDVRLVGEELAHAHPDLVTMPVRLPDAGLVELLAPGDRIDLLATDPQAGTTDEVAAGAIVLATPDPDAEVPAGSPPGALVLLGVPPESVAAVSGASVRWFLSYAFAD